MVRLRTARTRTLLLLFCVLLSSPTLFAQSRGKILMILPLSGTSVLVDGKSDPAFTDFMLTREAQVMKAMLQEAGFNVLSATPSGRLVGGAAVSLQPDLKLDDVQIADYVGVMVPCMGSNDPPNTKAVEIVSQAWKLGKPLAAQNGGVFTLGAAGVLQGRRFACQPGDAHWVADGIYGGDGVVVDGNVATSGTCPYMAQANKKPDGTAELTRKFIALLP